jgi:hypothetical protein
LKISKDIYPNPGGHISLVVRGNSQQFKTSSGIHPPIDERWMLSSMRSISWMGSSLNPERKRIYPEELKIISTLKFKKIYKTIFLK